MDNELAHQMAGKNFEKFSDVVRARLAALHAASGPDAFRDKSVSDILDPDQRKLYKIAQRVTHRADVVGKGAQAEIEEDFDVD